MFEGFETHDLATTEATIHLRIGGSGPPLLLLHGYPQTHAMWHKAAPALAADLTVVTADLRGYGDSSKPAGEYEHARYSKRAMAADQVAAMAAYRRCFSDPATIRASCENHRAAATIDLAHDASDNGRRVAAPTLALWGRDGFMQRTYDVLAEWRETCDNVVGCALPSGHFLAEEAPAETAQLRRFFMEE